MRLSQAYFFTLRETPQGAEIASHQLLVRAGYLRRLGSGSYAHLPLMRRVLNKIERVVRAELSALGAQEVALPLLQNAELWRESGRWDTYTRAEGLMFTAQDRAGRDLALAPTHEEAVTALARETLRSYRQLPAHLFQIGPKFRDELRPRFGLLRTREFSMKDGYSFHEDEASLQGTYEAVGAAYGRIFDRLGLAWRAVEADSGAIGGARSREFMVLAQAGEDEVLYTEDGRYAANAQKAESRPREAQRSPFQTFERRFTPGTLTVADACAALGCHASNVVKNVLYDATFDTGLLAPVLVSVRGDDDVNETKLANALARHAEHLGARALLALEVARPERWAEGELPLGFLAPNLGDEVIAQREGVHGRFLRFADHAATDLRNFTTGANQADVHVVGANWGEQFTLPEIVDLRQARAGERALHDEAQHLRGARGIEIGHIFQLGTRYSRAMNATFAGRNGQELPFHMGCYGIGLTRLAQAAAEQHFDSRGLAWPLALAPYHVIVTVANVQDEAQRMASEALYAQLSAAGVEAMLDDREERPGVKFMDADLIGIPLRVTVGRALARGAAELTERRAGTGEEVPLAQLVGRVRERLASLHEDAQNMYSYSL